MRLQKSVNRKLPGQAYHGGNPEDFPHPFFPFTAYLYISNPIKPNLSWNKCPDVFSELFEYEEYLRAFLFISDGDPDNHGHWFYSDDPDLDYAKYNTNESKLEVPGFWRCHNPNGLCNEHALICYNLGFDVPWRWKLTTQENDYIIHYRPWPRMIIAQEYSDPTPPGRVKFAEIMRDLPGGRRSYVERIPGCGCRMEF